MDYPEIEWKEGNLDQSLKTLYGYATASAEESLNYYRTNSRGKKQGAKILRITAIIAGALGGLIPIISQMYHDINAAWATVAITVALTALGLDRFFGFSSGWMRFITTELKIESKIQQFRINVENEKFLWSGQPLTFEKAKNMLVLIGSFLNEISGIVEGETNTWMVEFQNVIQKFNEEMNVKAASGALGGINITVENGEKCGKGMTLQLEGREPLTFNGTTYSVTNLYPKLYKLSLKGIIAEDKDGKTIEREAQANTLVNVTSGAVTATTLNLK